MRRKKGKGLEEARQAWASANADLERTHQRWPLVRSLAGMAHRVSEESSEQRQINHFGDLIARVLREG